MIDAGNVKSYGQANAKRSRRRRSPVRGRRDGYRRWLEPLESRQLLAGDLVAHWVADDLLTTHADGELVSAWVDRVSQQVADSGGTPTFAQGAVGGRAAIRFDASDGRDILQLARSKNPLVGAADLSAVVVFQTNSNSLVGDGDPWYDGTGLVTSSAIGLSQDWGVTIDQQGRVAAGVGAGIGGATTSIRSPSSARDGQLHTAIFVRQGGQLSLQIDGNPAVTTSGADTQPRGLIEITIGGMTAQSSGGFSGEIAEVRLYQGALDATQTTAIRAELVNYYDNRPPVAVDDHYQVEEDASFFLVPANLGVLANDSDPNGDRLTAKLVREPMHGTVSLSADGSFIYDSDRDFHGEDSFTYIAMEVLESNEATVTITVTPVSDPPVGEPDRYLARPTEPLQVSAVVGVLSNDVNVEGNPLKVRLEQLPAFGSLLLAEDGSFRFDAQGQAGTAEFTYRIDDSVGLSAPVRVTIDSNTIPQPADDEYRTNEDQPLLVGAASGVLANDRDADGNALTVIAVDPPTHGELVLNPDGAFSYVPAAEFHGEDQFTYKVADYLEESALVTVRVIVEPVNDAPVAGDDVFFADAGANLIVPADSGVLQNDTDIEGDALTAIVEQDVVNGSLTLNEDGSFTYRPVFGFKGQEEFVYRVTDANGGTNTGRATIFVGVSPVQITEIMAANGTTLPTRTRINPDDRFTSEVEFPDWIEVSNLSSGDFDLSGYHLTDSADDLSRWAFPAGSVVPANGYLIVYASAKNITDPQLDEHGRFHTDFKLDSEVGEYLALTTPQGAVLHELAPTYPPQIADVSYGLIGDEYTYLVEPTPGAENVGETREGIVSDAESSKPGGYYSAPFEVTIATESENAAIRYTLDGSTPTEENGMVYAGPFTVEKTTLLRTRAFKDGMVPSHSRSYSYLYLDEMLHQPSNPEGFPAVWGRAGAADYAMDPRITLDTTSSYYIPTVRAALQTHDAISIVTDMEHLFDTRTGIYANPESSGVTWERPASAELITKDGVLEFQINAGLRIQGGASRNPNRPKHNMRLLFKEQYGASKLEYPLFEGGDVERYDTLILRGGNGDSWFHPTATQQVQAQYIRDQWTRETQRLMGRLTVDQRYIHLYINGLYWGLYHIFEKPNANFFAEHFGGLPEEYDVIQHQGGTVDGNRDSWNEVMQLAREGLETPEAYAKVHDYVDVPGLIDYLLINYYAGNVDWDQNNWFGGRKREPGAQYQFFTWDAERTFLNVRDNRVTAVNAGQPTDLQRRLTDNAEYRLLFADHVHRHFFNDGLLTPTATAERWQMFVDEIEVALGAESARWGDNKRASRPYTPDAEWRRETERLMTTWFPDRTEIVLGQLRARNLYPRVDAPSFNQHGGDVSRGFELTMSAPAGVVYYTTDGSDPRLEGGEVSPTALVYSQAEVINADTVVKSRSLVDGVWSALNEAAFFMPSEAASENNVRISEIHYHPADPTSDEIAAGFDDADDFEFVEIVNIGEQVVDLTELSFVEVATADGEQGMRFDFRGSAITRLAPGQYVLVVEQAAAFAHRYGDQLPVAGVWSGRLSNGGERITLSRQGEIIQQVSYSDDWYPATDGNGPSLELIDPTGTSVDELSQAASWRVSATAGGSPGRSTALVPGDSNHDGRFDSADFVTVFLAGEYEDAIPGNSTFEEGDWDGDGDFTSSDMIFVFRIGHYDDERAARMARELRLRDQWFAEAFDEAFQP